MSVSAPATAMTSDCNKRRKHPRSPFPGPAKPRKRPFGLHYDPAFLGARDRDEILAWLRTIHPIWEDRYPDGHREQRRLLRPVYWLGAWQFACLDYYRPPHGARDRAVRAEPFPPVL